MAAFQSNGRVIGTLPEPVGQEAKLVADVVGAVERNTGKGGRILNAGYGSGNYSIELGRRGYEVEGIEFCYDALERARLKRKKERIENVEFKEWEMGKDLPLYADGFFDCVLSIRAMCALGEHQLAISEYLRVLKPSGVLIMVEPHNPIGADSFVRGLDKDDRATDDGRLVLTQCDDGVCSLVTSRRSKERCHHFWNEEELRSKLEESGIRIDTMVPANGAGSYLLATAVKPRYYFETGGYRFLSAETRGDLDDVWRLRYQVYCVELVVEPENHSGHLEDVYDEYATQFLALDNDGRPVGILRAIPDNPRGFPMDSDFPLIEYMKANGISRAVEGGKFVVHRDVVPEARATVGFGLFKGLIDYCRETGVNDIFVTTQSKIAQRYKTTGFEQIGEPFESQGPLSGVLWVPMRCDIRKVYDGFLGDVQGHPELP
jgi:ubiquinone/menaquinone biosynthesis C-methylase UbiE/N-acyl-L-homoserine lactone synthetase